MSQSHPFSSLHAAPTSRDPHSRLSTASVPPMLHRPCSPLLRYGVAVISALLAVLFRELLTPGLGNHQLPFLTLYPAVLISTWYGGLGPGLVTTAMGTVAAAYFWVSPFYSLAVHDLGDRIGLALAMVVMLLITWLTASLRRMQATLEQRVHERTVALEVEIAERQQAEETLRRQALLFTYVSDAIVMADDTGRVIEWNAAAEQLYGYTREEMVGQLLDSLFPTAGTLAEVFVLVQQQGRFAGEVAILRKDGSPGVVDAVVVPVVDASGKPCGVVGVSHDITSRKRLEAELRTLNTTLEQRVQERTAALQESQQFLTHITEAIPVLLYIYDLQQQRNVYVNSQSEAILGYTTGEFQQFGPALLSTLTHPDDLEKIEERMRATATMRAGHLSTLEYRMRHKNGDWRWLHGQEVVFRYTADGAPWQVMGAALDITARKQAEAALQESEARFRLLADSAPVLIWVNNLQGCEFVNQEYMRFIGVKADAVLGYDWTPYVHPDDRDMYVRTYLEALTQRSLFTAQFRFRRYDGVYRWMHSIALPRFDAHGACLGYVGSTTDITDLKDAQDALAQHARDLALAHADLRQVAYASAHDLQEPVRQVGVYTQMIAQRYHDAMDADVQEAIAFVVEGSKRMQAQFTDLMHYLEIEEPGEGITMIDCETVLRRALDGLQETIASSGATITHDPLPTIAVNARHLQIVFQELIDNAMKFGDGTPPQVHVWAEREEQAWRFAVRDNGLGIAQQGIAQLFGFFRKLHRRQDYPGTGMGLAICKKIVDRHGGRIWVNSQPGEGATFYFTISDK